MPSFRNITNPAITRSGLEGDRSGLPTPSGFSARLLCPRRINFWAVSRVITTSVSVREVTAPGIFHRGLPWATTDSFPLALSFFVGVSCSRPHSKARPCLWNHGTESNRHAILSVACGIKTTAGYKTPNPHIRRSAVQNFPAI